MKGLLIDENPNKKRRPTPSSNALLLLMGSVYSERQRLNRTSSVFFFVEASLSESMRLGFEGKLQQISRLHSPLTKTLWVILHFGIRSNTWHGHLGLTLLRLSRVELK